MAVYIKYINKTNFLTEELVDDALSDSATKNVNLKLADIFNTDYIKKKLKQLIFQIIPAFKNAIAEILELLVIIVISYCQKLIRNFKKSISSLSEGIQSIFEEVNFFLKNNITQIQQIYFFENDFDLDAKDLENKLKEFPSFEIDFQDIEKINQFCKLDEIQIFALETEDNYLCLPFNDKKKFRAVKIANYYDAYFDITDQESNDILEILIEYKEKGTKNFERKIGNTPKFTYKIVEYNENDSWDGRFIQNECIKIKEKDENDLLSMYNNFTHEFMHYKDFLLNKNKFTNLDFSAILEKLSVLKEGKIISYDKMKNLIIKVLNLSNTETDDSSARYIISLLQKKKYIDYYEGDFTKIKINNIPKYVNSSKTAEGEYYNSPIEKNTHLNDTINQIIQNFEVIENEKNSDDDQIKKDKEDDLMIGITYKVDQIYNEILEKDEFKKFFKTPDQKIKLHNDLLKYYEKKVNEKIKNYQSNREKNKEKFNKIKSNQYYE